MILKRVEVTRFGRLEPRSFGDFAEGLNVVVGPNEAGKTTFVNFVRQALFGYAGKRDKEESPYLSSAGKRFGRLVFANDGSEWSVERTEGPHGGSAKVSTLKGSECSDLMIRLTRGVSAKTYRVVFGFGLSELAQIEDGRMSGDGVLSRLYAAQTGSAASPADVKKEFEKTAAVVKTEYNKLKSKIKSLNKEIVELEVAAAAFVNERQRLDELSVRLEEALSSRDQAHSAFHEYSLALEGFEIGKRRLDEAVAEEEKYETEHVGKLQQLENIAVDHRMSELADQMESVLDDLSGFRQRLDALRGHNQNIAALRVEAERALSEAALDPLQASTVDIGPETIAGIERWRKQMAEAQAACNLSSRDADEAESSVRGFDPPLVAVSGTMSSQKLPAAVLFIAGLLLLIGGVFLGEMVIAISGFVLAILGIAMYVWVVRTEKDALSGGLAAVNLEQQAIAARRKADTHAARLDDVCSEWKEWLTPRGLAFAGEDPVAVSIVVAAIRQWRGMHLEIDKARAVSAEDEKWCQEYKRRLAAAGGEVAPGLEDAVLDDVPMHAAVLRKKLEENISATREREAAGRDVGRLKGLIETAKRKREKIAQEIEDTLAKFGITMREESKLRALAENADEALRKANEDCDTLLQEHTALAQRLDLATQDSTMALKRLHLAEEEERRVELVDKYAILVLAARLITLAQDYHRHARQPEVIRKAGEIFGNITAGKYSGISAPDGGEFMVFGQQSEEIPSSELSTGTVQQLYLALRFALIETLDGIGEGLPVLMDDILVNADPERRERLAKAISELSSKRQVIFFTCHPDTAELFGRVCPAATRINL